MPVARPESSDSRVIAHIDLDCFYVQVEQRKQPQLRGLPTAVVQYNEWKGGALIAVSYEARKFGVKRSMRGEEAKEVCPQIQLVQVPVAHCKADLSTYRNAGSEVVSVLSRKGRCERASIDEVYLDLTHVAETMLLETPPESLEEIDEEALKSHILGLRIEEGTDAIEDVREWMCRSNAEHKDKLLACGILIVAELRRQVLKETEFTCSAGIAHNKMLAKLASGMNKPAQQTVVPFSSVKGLLGSLPIRKMKQLGGKLGVALQVDLGVNNVGDLLQFPEAKLQEHYGVNTGTWLWNIARGIDGEEVEGRLLPKSHGSGKSFPGPRALKTISSVQYWLNQLCEELNERLCSDLDQNKRIAHTLTLHVRAYKSSDTDSQKKFPSKSCPLRYGTAKVQEDAFNLFQAGFREYIGFYGVKTQGIQCNGWGITALSISASKIVPLPSGTCSIMKYFHGPSTSNSSKQLVDNSILEVSPLSPSGGERCSEVNSCEPKIEFLGEEERWNKDPLPVLGQEEEERSILKGQDPSCSSSKAQDGVIQETSLVIPTGGARFLEQNQSTQLRVLGTNDSQVKSEHKEHKRKMKDKGTPSILKFFKSCNPSGPSESQEQVQTLQENGTNSSDSTSYPSGQRREAWSYRIDEIDPTVIDELPPEIQDELRAWMQPHKQPNVVNRGSIARYFSPIRKT
ncbi:hypothetical protein SLE2022_255340 [Rubroshorea leprosula]